MISFKAISTVIFLCIYLCKGCKDDADCDIANTVCSSRQCICPKGFVMNSDMTACMQVADGYGSECEDSVQCSAVLLSGGQCLNGTCNCATGYHYLQGRCWKTSKLDGMCAKDQNCFVNFDFESSVCSKERTCVCSPDYYQREYSSCRKISKAPGDPCLIILDCQYEGADCLKNRKCGYKNQEEPESPEPTPQPIKLDTSKQLGGKCVSNSDCIRNAMCNARKECVCKTGYYSLNNSLCAPEIGTHCQPDECVGAYMTCREKKNWCACQDGYVASPDNRYCTKMARDIDWSCLTDRWCTTFGPGGRCVDKKCHCSNSTHYVPDQYFCWVSKKVGEKCQSNEDCGSDPASETCIKGICMCNKGFHPSTNKTVCRPDGNSIGDYCQENLDCKMDNSMCNTTSDKCVCQPGYMIQDNKCVPGVGATCNENEKCQASGSFCNNTICSCDDNHVSSLDYSKCLNIINEYMESCQESQQCTPLLGDGGTCDGNCTCSEGYHIVDSYCYVDIALYMTCTNTPECQVDNSYSECRKGVCHCMYSHPPDAFNRTCTDGASTLIVPFFLLMASLLLMLISR